MLQWGTQNYVLISRNYKLEGMWISVMGMILVSLNICSWDVKWQLVFKTSNSLEYIFLECKICWLHEICDFPFLWQWGRLCFLLVLHTVLLLVFNLIAAFCNISMWLLQNPLADSFWNTKFWTCLDSILTSPVRTGLLLRKSGLGTIYNL
jgi:hypothetical protein